ncbi:uncharacterized protein LOC127245608 [Andrographis paniculata]|uniref:uncharacterized protein LOC127245608 n=1 Tax=Andrographis paniculata TaxID=175694 RepID=UPI0021E880F6|nr:uncharacterized protein LOC127245608 [Andrographis paniculata]
MGQMTNGKSKKGAKEEIKKEEVEEEEEEQEQDGVSVHSPCKINSSTLRKENSEVELELRLLEALEIYPPSKLRGPHRHFVLYGLTEYMRKSFDRPFTADECLKLLGRFYNLDMVKPDDEDAEFLSQEEDFHLPKSYFEEET